MSSDELLTIEELADYLKVRPRTIYPWARSGMLPAVKIVGQWRFRKRDIDRWLAQKANGNGNNKIQAKLDKITEDAA